MARVAIVVLKYNPFGGYERQAALLAGALAKRGDSVSVFSSEWKGEVPEGITFEKVPIIKAASWLKVLSFALHSRRSLLERRGEFDVIIGFDRTLVMDIYRAGNACHREWMAFRRSHEGVGGAVSMALNPLHRVINSMEGRLFSTIKEEGGTIVALSEEGVRQIRKHYAVPPDRFTIIPPAVDLSRLDGAYDRVASRKALGIDEKRLVLLHVGSGFRIKGLSSTIEALAHLVKGGVDAELLVAGSDRKESARLEGLTKSLGLKERVRFLGGVKEVGRVYAASDVFVLPTHFETFALSAIEALYMGLPVVIGKGAGCWQVIENNGAGKAVDVPAKPEALSRALMAVMTAEKALKDRGRLDDERKRRREIASGFSLDNVIRKYASLIDRIAAERKEAVRPVRRT